MRFVFIFKIFIGLLCGQSGSELTEYFFNLQNKEDFQNLQNSEILISELDKMVDDFEKNIRFDNAHKVGKIERVEVLLPLSLDWKGFTYQLRLDRKTYSGFTIINGLKNLKVYDSLNIEQFNKQATSKIKAKEEETAIALKETVFELEQKRRNGEIIDERAEIDLKNAKEKLESDLEQFRSSLESQMEEFAKYNYSVKIDSIRLKSPNACTIYSTFIVESKKMGK